MVKSIKKVLIIEDDSLTLLVLKNLLHSIDMEVVALNDGRNFQLEMDHIDAAIIDCGLPFVSGQEIAASIKNTHPNVKVILTSILEMDEIDYKLLKMVDGFIGKPYDSEKIDILFEKLN